MSEKQPFNYKPADYLKGRVALPLDVHALEKETYFYGDDVTIANGAKATINLAIEDDSHFLAEAIQIISSLQTTSQDLLTVQITDTGSSRSWSNKAVPLRDLAGRGDVPKYLTDPQLLRPASTISIEITNNTGSAVQVYAALYGKKIFGISKEQAAFMGRRQWYQYVLDVTTLAGSAAEKLFTVQIENKADFLVKRLLSSQLIAAVIGAAAGAESAEVLWQIRNKSTGRALFNKPLAARLMLGQLAGEFFNNAASFGPGGAFPLKTPWLVRRNGVIEGTFYNRSTDAFANGFKIIFEGIKNFDA